jgi:Caspase domain
MGIKALLIANGAYPQESGLTPLKGPKNDLRAMKDALLHPKYGLLSEANITCCEEYESDGLAGAIEGFLDGTSSDDAILIYFSGHGLRPYDELFLATRNTKWANYRVSVATAVSSSQINQMLRQRNVADQTIFILDCCHAGAFLDKGSSATKLRDDLQKIFPGQWVLCSSSETEPSKDGRDGEPSQFTKELTKALLNPEILAPDESGLIYLDTVFSHIAGKIQPPPVIKSSAQGPAAIAKRHDPLSADGAQAAYPELDSLEGPDFPVDHEITLPDQDVTVIRNLSALLDLIGRDQSLQHRETVDTVHSFTAEFLWRQGIDGEVLAKIPRRPTRQLTRLRLRIPDRRAEQLPWEYLTTSSPPPGMWQGPLALRRNLIIERRASPENEDLRLEPQDKVTVNDVMIVGNPAEGVPATAAEALRQDLDNLGITVNAPKSGRGWVLGNITYVQEWSPVLVLMTDVRRVKDGGQAVQLRLAGPDGGEWIPASQLHEELQFAGREEQAPFRVILIESFATEPGNDAQGASAELAASLASLGVGNVIFLCHPAEFAGYERREPGRPRTFAGNLIGALNAPATVPHAFYLALQRMQRTFHDRCERAFGLPGLYIPDYRQKEQAPPPPGGELPPSRTEPLSTGEPRGRTAGGSSSPADSGPGDGWGGR